LFPLPRKYPVDLDTQHDREYCIVYFVFGIKFDVFSGEEENGNYQDYFHHEVFGLYDAWKRISFSFFIYIVYVSVLFSIRFFRKNVFKKMLFPHTFSF